MKGCLLASPFLVRQKGLERAAPVYARSAHTGAKIESWRAILSLWENPWTCERTRMGVGTSPFCFLPMDLGGIRTHRNAARMSASGDD